MSLDATNNPMAKQAPKDEVDPESLVGLESGGSVTVVYGILVVLFALGCSAASMAELSSVYPTAGGPYHWASILAPKKYHRVISYACAAFNIYGWLSICVGVTVQIGTFVNGMRVFYNPSLDLPVWHNFLYYQATNIVILLYNIFALRRTQWIHSLGAVFSLAAFVAVFVTSLSRAESYSSSSFVWTYYPGHEWTWDSRGLVFLTGMANPNFMYAGIDGAIHLAEECTDATTTVPRALFSSIVIGFFTAFPFVIAMLYCLTDIDKVMEDLTGVPIYEIWYQATRSREAATVFVTCLLMVALFALNACQEVASRLTWAFARDNALVGSKLFGHINKRLKVPVWALAGNALVIFIIGCIQLGSSTAFEAFVGSGMLLQQCGFAIPVALLLWHKRSDQVLARNRNVRLGPFGWLANIVTVLFAILVTVMYCFPVRLPVTGGNMNYTAAVVGVMAIFAVVNWFIHANRNFQGPRLQGGFLH
ncbi:hypothetical protein ASPVEDRAFT_56994 [Aspergillus versicolor CBS 583.65]|uniref:Amino acid permease/ SLC12A domain-containing protein n=1 Tax=Aspergillus versicolor CBS 583.65 TaxID=1036611 RepID=A0A1L9Q1P2_ASPVE|nr:uncharacterized protein ASPVEDRAFT_56994 [Aspergillus versicolor CBS 583.65]OJJ07695.1 hypothetical protein ASPVEDRAFT_56994 [Aspergillus versicolor CBS 583.65]